MMVNSWHFLPCITLLLTKICLYYMGLKTRKQSFLSRLMYLCLLYFQHLERRFISGISSFAYQYRCSNIHSWNTALVHPFQVRQAGFQLPIEHEIAIELVDRRQAAFKKKGAFLIVTIVLWLHRRRKGRLTHGKETLKPASWPLLQNLRRVSGQRKIFR